MFHHPFADQNEIRLSPRDAVKEILDSEHTCIKCRGKSFSVIMDKETFPKIKDGSNRQRVSTCDLITCNRCGQQWEVAFSICYSMMEIANPIAYKLADEQEKEHQATLNDIPYNEAMKEYVELTEPS